MQTRIIHILFYDLETELLFYRTKPIKTAFMHKFTTEQNLLKQSLCINWNRIIYMKLIIINSHLHKALKFTKFFNKHLLI